MTNLSDKILNNIILALENGGATLTLKIENNQIQDIYQVKPFNIAGYRYVVAFETFMTVDNATLKAFLASSKGATLFFDAIRRAYILKGDNNQYVTLGLWYDKGIMHFERVSLERDLKPALRLATINNQYAIYDLINGLQILTEDCKGFENHTHLVTVYNEGQPINAFTTNDANSFYSLSAQIVFDKRIEVERIK